jgi:hypothetical protein
METYTNFKLDKYKKTVLKESRLNGIHNEQKLKFLCSLRISFGTFWISGS